MLANRVIEMPAAIRSGRFFCNLFFFAAGVGIGSWASCLPVLSAQNSLEKGELGLILLCFALGAIVAMTNVGRLTSHYSCSTLSLGGALTFGTALVIVPFVSGNAWLASVVFVAGSGFGTLDVSMNTDASALERRSGRHLMSSFHAMFSFGNLAGAFTVGQILSHGGALAICLGATGVGVATFAIVARLGSSRNADPADALQAGASSGGRLDRAQKAYLYLIGAIAFLSMMGEGGIMDWSAIYIVNVFSGSDSAGAYGFAVFATMMAVGRLFGDAITARIGSTRFLYYCSIICAASVGLLVLAANVVVVFLALAICGLSVANLVPLAFAAAGRSGGAFAGRAMSIVTTMGYAGLLLGPAVLGFVAQASSLSVTFMLIAAAFILVALATRALRKE
ncbi:MULTISPECIES: MFS transporter [Mesorhizobium]|nr:MULTISPECIES: MFS transporter [Mesorhizobium]ETA71296.1 fucose permease [Mesorhizobium japonicum R7A]